MIFHLGAWIRLSCIWGNCSNGKRCMIWHTRLVNCTKNMYTFAIHYLCLYIVTLLFVHLNNDRVHQTLQHWCSTKLLKWLKLIFLKMPLSFISKNKIIEFSFKLKNNCSNQLLGEQWKWLCWKIVLVKLQNMRLAQVV